MSNPHIHRENNAITKNAMILNILRNIFNLNDTGLVSIIIDRPKLNLLTNGTTAHCVCSVLIPKDLVLYNMLITDMSVVNINPNVTP
jgi:hypothetical protein